MLKDNPVQTPAQPMPRKEPQPKAPAPQRPGEAPVQPQKSSHSHGLTLAIICVLVALVVVWGVKRHAATKKAAAAASAKANSMEVPIVAGKVRQKNVPIYLDGLGTVQAFNTVTVQVRVDGQLEKVAFVEGQDVHTGDLLAQIDPAPYQAALDQAVAKKAQDQAQLTNARLDLVRDANLYTNQISSQQVYDTQKALVDQLDATVKADQAAIEAAQVNVNYTRITSPLDGRTGIRLVDQGNQVHATDPGGLVVITQLKPISVVFTLPEQDLESIQEEASDASGDQFTVLAVGRDNNTILDTGTLAVVNNLIDTNTGTIKIKATFPNEDLRLWPGQFVNARLLLTTRSNGIVVPAAAVQRGPDGSYVFVVSDMTAQVRPVSVAQIEDGQALIDKGLTNGESIVLEGQYKLQEGSKVRLGSGTNSTSNASSGQGHKHGGTNNPDGGSQFNGS